MGGCQQVVVEVNLDMLGKGFARIDMYCISRRKWRYWWHGRDRIGVGQKYYYGAA
jgi:hypothetical protein